MLHWTACLLSFFMDMFFICCIFLAFFRTSHFLWFFYLFILFLCSLLFSFIFSITLIIFFSQIYSFRAPYTLVFLSRVILVFFLNLWNSANFCFTSSCFFFFSGLYLCRVFGFLIWDVLSCLQILVSGFLVQVGVWHQFSSALWNIFKIEWERIFNSWNALILIICFFK